MVKKNYVCKFAKHHFLYLNASVQDEREKRWKTIDQENEVICKDF